jgi:hypothetical protein
MKLSISFSNKEVEFGKAMVNRLNMNLGNKQQDLTVKETIMKKGRWGESIASDTNFDINIKETCVMEAFNVFETFIVKFIPVINLFKSNFKQLEETIKNFSVKYSDRARIKYKNLNLTEQGIDIFDTSYNIHTDKGTILFTIQDKYLVGDIMEIVDGKSRIVESEVFIQYIDKDNINQDEFVEYINMSGLIAPNVVWSKEKELQEKRNALVYKPLDDSNSQPISKSVVNETPVSKDTITSPDVRAVMTYDASEVNIRQWIIYIGDSLFPALFITHRNHIIAISAPDKNDEYVEIDRKHVPEIARMIDEPKLIDLLIEWGSIK